MFKIPQIPKGSSILPASWFRQMELWQRAQTPMPSSDIGVQTGPGGTTLYLASRNGSRGTSALPTFWLYRTGDLEAKVTAGTVVLFGSPTAVDASAAITIPDDTSDYKVWLQWVQGDSPALTFGDDTDWPTLVDFFPLGTITTSDGAITGISRTWTGGTLIWPAKGDLSGVIPVPANTTYTLEEYVTEPCLIERVAFKLDSGSLTAAIKINGTAVTSLSAISVTTTQSVTAATGANSVAYGQRITLVVSSISSPANLAFTLAFM